MAYEVLTGKVSLILAGSSAAALVLWLVRKHYDGGWCYSKARLDGKTVVITGANTGIGKETARDLARRGARVILACRDLARAQAAATEICKDTGSTNVIVRKIDLASLASIREFAEKIKSEESRLDVLINNAGIMMCPEWKTEDGFEMQFGVNHLGHFLLTNLLLDLIKSSAPSRIINVSSNAHYGAQKIYWDDLNMRSTYETVEVYSHSKLANVLFTRELSKRLKGSRVTVNALYPGLIATELTRHVHLGNTLPIRLFVWILTHFPVRHLMIKSPVQGAQTSIYCAVTEDLQETTGLYFSDCATKKASELALDDESARRLWELSAEMVSLEKKTE